MNPALLSSLLSAAVVPQEPERIEVAVQSEARWFSIPAEKAEAGRVAPDTEHSAVRIWIAVEPKTGKPYVDPTATLGFDPLDLRRRFRLEKRRFLLGEPILVKLEIGLAADGTWQEVVGGRYRGSGRDDNFLFVLERPDGTLVDDPYPDNLFYGGGLSTRYAATAAKPLELWFGAQRWCAVAEPGSYVLHCFHLAHTWKLHGQVEAARAALPVARPARSPRATSS